MKIRFIEYVFINSDNVYCFSCLALSKNDALRQLAETLPLSLIKIIKNY